MKRANLYSIVCGLFIGFFVKELEISILNSILIVLILAVFMNIFYFSLKK